MRSLTLVLTSICNLRCTYCYQDCRSGMTMDWETARSALDALLQSHRRELQLHLYGGEPLVAFPLFRRAVEYVRAATPEGRTLRIDTTTNGLLLDNEKIDFLAAHEIDVQVSFDGVPAAQDLRRAGSFRLLDERLQHVRREWPAFFEDRLGIAITVTAANLSALGDSVDYFLDLGVPSVLLGPRLTHDPDWRPGHAREMRRQLARVCRLSRNHLRRTGSVPLRLFRKGRGQASPRTQRTRMCGVGSVGSLVVDVDGSVYGCVLFARSYQRLDSPALRRWIAPLSGGRFDDHWLARRLRAVRARLRRSALFTCWDQKRSGHGRCAHCPERARCAVCPVSIAHVHGNDDPHRVPDLPCAFFRSAGPHIRHFPVQPTEADRLSGRVNPPEMLRELLAVNRQRLRNGRG